MNTYYIAGFPVSDELYHHGILGQKWGVRRFQNEDGSLTEEGKRRYLASLYRGTTALNKNKNRGSAYKSTAIKGIVRGLTVAGIKNVVKNGMKYAIGNTGASIIIPAGVVSPPVMAGILALSATLTVKDLYKAIRQDKDIAAAYEAGQTQKKYREAAEVLKVSK